MHCGADMAAQSTHKILGALTQCSLLQVKGARIDLRHAADVMSLLTTTSPNYLLMGSLDAARAQLAERGAVMLEDALRAAQMLRNSLAKIPGLHVIRPEDVAGKYGIAALDSTKRKNCGGTGRFAERFVPGDVCRLGAGAVAGYSEPDL